MGLRPKNDCAGEFHTHFTRQSLNSTLEITAAASIEFSRRAGKLSRIQTTRDLSSSAQLHGVS
jgi:hypothetical protein